MASEVRFSPVSVQVPLVTVAVCGPEVPLPESVMFTTTVEPGVTVPLMDTLLSFAALIGSVAAVTATAGSSVSFSEVMLAVLVLPAVSVAVTL